MWPSFCWDTPFSPGACKEARQFAEANYYRVRAVTLDGDLIQPGGLITGGREDQPAQLAIRRKREIVQLSEDRNRGQQALEALEKKRDALTGEQNCDRGQDQRTGNNGAVPGKRAQ